MAEWRKGGLILLAGAWLSAIPPFRHSAGQDPWPILDRASVAYASVRTLSADFVQVIDNPMLGAPDTTRGRLFLRKPNHFAMRFTEPRGDRIVADGRALWLYTPSSTPGQVIRSAIPSTGTTGPNLIGQFVEQPRDRYDARFLRGDSAARPADAIALTPIATDLPYSSATVWIDREDAMIRRIDLVEASGQRRSVILRNVVVNGDVPRREFRFSPPAGSRVVHR